MPKFSYIAKSFGGGKETGILEAENESRLAQALKQQGLVLISAELEGQKKKKGLGISINVPGFGKVSLVEKMMFTRNLKVMISAGMALPKTLEILSKQAKDKKFCQAILDVREEIAKGNSFSSSLLKHPNIFPELFVSMIEVGEEGGKLEEVLEILTKQMEKQYELKSKIMGALMYPAVVISAMILIGALMLMMVVPKLALTFREFNAELPQTTRFVIWIGQALATRWYVIILAIILLLISVSQIKKTATGKKMLDSLTLKVPIISPLIKKTNSAYTARILSSLISSGVPIAESLDILSRTLTNIYYQTAVNEAGDTVRKGGKLSEALANYPKIYPLLITQMIAVGEETGQTSDILGKLADFQEDEVASASKNLASIIEPLVMLLIGGAVGFFAISMVQPMYSMLGAIK